MRKSWVRAVDDMVIKLRVMLSLFCGVPFITHIILGYFGRFSTLNFTVFTPLSRRFYPLSTRPITTNILNNYLITYRGCV